MTTTRNLILNGDAETGPLSADYSVAAPAGWLVDGNFSAVSYSAGSSDPAALHSDTAAPGGTGYFAGGLGASSDAVQTIDLSAYASAIDGGSVQFDFAADLGGYDVQNDGMTVEVEFLNVDNGVLGTASLGPVTAADRGNMTELLHRDEAGFIPVGTRTVVVTLVATNAGSSGSYDDGYADNISLTLSGSGISGGVVQVTASHDYHHKTLGPVNGIQFEGAHNSTATFSSDQFATVVSSTTTTILGDTHTDTLDILVGSSHSFLSFLTFENWSAADKVNITGTSSGDTIFNTGVDDTIHGGDGGDVFEILVSSNDAVFGDAGDDTIVMDRNLTARDQINGGADNDTLQLVGGYSAGLTFNNSTVSNIETILLFDNDSYKLTSADGNVAAGATMTVDGSNLSAGDTLNFNGGKESNGAFILLGGDDNDTLTGGAGNDTIRGGLGVDHLAGGGGADRFVYLELEDSTSSVHDTIDRFDASADKIDISGMGIVFHTVDAAVHSGKLTTAQFDANLAKAVGKHQLAAHDAVIFTPTKGNFHGDAILVIDVNGHAGYQADEDLVIEFTHPANLASFGAADIVN